MDDTDNKILDLINKSFPVHERPYGIIAEKIGISVDEVIKRIKDMKEAGIIRRIGATINTRGIGWYSTLCAIDLPEDRLDDYTAIVNAYPGITHNYIRSGKPNCWFTLIARDESRALKIMDEIRSSLGVDILNLPARRIFKIKVGFNIG